MSNALQPSPRYDFMLCYLPMFWQPHGKAWQHTMASKSLSSSRHHAREHTADHHEHSGIMAVTDWGPTQWPLLPVNLFSYIQLGCQTRRDRCGRLTKGIGMREVL